MWENDCGILPVVINGGNAVGVITEIFTRRYESWQQ
jgi:hypothetical protein